MGLMINKNTNATFPCSTEKTMLDNGWSANEWAFFDKECGNGKVYKYVNGDAIDISQSPEYLNKVKIEKKKDIVAYYKELFNELDMSYTRKIVTNQTTLSVFSAARAALQTELTTKLSEV